MPMNLMRPAGSFPKFSIIPKPASAAIIRSADINTISTFLPAFPRLSFKERTTGMGRGVFSKGKKFLLKLCVDIPPLNASSTGIFLRGALMDAERRTAMIRSAQMTLRPVIGLKPHVHSRPSIMVITTAKYLKVTTAAITPRADPVRVTRSICTNMESLSSVTVYPQASRIPVFFMLLAIKFLMLKDMTTSDITRMMIAKISITAINTMGMNCAPPRIICQLMSRGSGTMIPGFAALASSREAL